MDCEVIMMAEDGCRILLSSSGTSKFLCNERDKVVAKWP